MDGYLGQSDFLTSINILRPIDWRLSLWPSKGMQCFGICRRASVDRSSSGMSCGLLLKQFRASVEGSLHK